MRKLGHGQSVMFFAPPEIDRQIREASSSKSTTTLDILRWAMLETCNDIMHHAPHWAQQGVDHGTRHKAWNEYFTSRDLEIFKLSWLQQEARTLEDMYGVATNHISSDPEGLTSFSTSAMRERCSMLGVTSLGDTRMEEEQEREVNHEVQVERQVERPPNAIPAKHQLHPDVLGWIQTGEIASSSDQFVSVDVFFSVAGISASMPDAQIWSPKLLATRDFCMTIQSRGNGANRDFLRPVNWITSNCSGKLVVLSPFEVNELLPEIRRSNSVYLHQYTPRVTLTMKPLDDLKFHTIPPLPSSWTPPEVDLRNQLNLWAGQLYLEDYPTYLRLCTFLGLYTQAGDREVELDGFIKPEHRPSDLEPHSPFTESPVDFLKDLIALRRKGMGFMRTDLGKILRARLLQQDVFDR